MSQPFAYSSEILTEDDDKQGSPSSETWEGRSTYAFADVASNLQESSENHDSANTAKSIDEGGSHECSDDMDQFKDRFEYNSPKNNPDDYDTMSGYSLEKVLPTVHALAGTKKGVHVFEESYEPAAFWRAFLVYLLLVRRQGRPDAFYVGKPKLSALECTYIGARHSRGVESRAP